MDSLHPPTSESTEAAQNLSSPVEPVKPQSSRGAALVVDLLARAGIPETERAALLEAITQEARAVKRLPAKARAEYMRAARAAIIRATTRRPSRPPAPPLPAGRIRLRPRVSCSHRSSRPLAVRAAVTKGSDTADPDGEPPRAVVSLRRPAGPLHAVDAAALGDAVLVGDVVAEASGVRLVDCGSLLVWERTAEVRS